MSPGKEYPPNRARGGTEPHSGQGASRGKARKPRRVYWGRRVILLLILLLLLAAGFVAYLLVDANKAIKEISSGASAIPEAESVAKRPVALLLMGLDTRDDDGGLLNTDVLMAAAFNPRTKSAVVVSIPRDSRIPVKGYKQRKVNSYYSAFISTAKSKHKGISHAEAEQIGKQEMKKAIGGFLDVPIQYAATINFQGFADIVDALGGVTVNVDMSMDYNDHAGQPGGTSIHLREGVQTLGGEDALGFVRYRKSNDGKNMSSDFQRNERQGQMLGAITDKIKSVPGMLRLGKVFGAVGSNMQADMPESEIRRMMTAYFGISKENIEFIPLTGNWKSPYVYLDEASVKKASQALRSKLDE